MTEITHHTRGIRVAPRKLRLVVDKVRHMPAGKALEILPLVPNRGALHVQKALKAAVGAASDKDLAQDSLVIQRIFADEGTAMKRVVRHSRGRAATIMKKYSHLTIVLKGETAVAAPARRRAKASEPTETTLVEEK
jgi:large subunit ribosomal protein L22